MIFFQQNFMRSMFHFVISTVFADDVASLGDRTSAGTDDLLKVLYMYWTNTWQVKL